MRDALLWAVLFQAHENALRLIKAGARADHGFSRRQTVPDYHPYGECALGLCVEDDAFLPCTKLIHQTHPDFPEGLLRNCMHHALSNLSKNQATIRWLIERRVGLGPLQKGELRDYRRMDPHKVNMSTLHHVAGSDVLPLDLLAAVLEKRPQDINVASKEGGHTPLSMALKLGFNSEMVAFLLANGADPAACTPRNGRDILVAVKKGIRPSVIQKLQASLDARTQAEQIKISWELWGPRWRRWTYTEKQRKQLQSQDFDHKIVDEAIGLGLSIDEIIQLPYQGKSAKEECRRLWKEKDDEVHFAPEQFDEKFERKQERRRRKSLRRHRLGIYHDPERLHRFSYYLRHPGD